MNTSSVVLIVQSGRQEVLSMIKTTSLCLLSVAATLTCSFAFADDEVDSTTTTQTTETTETTTATTSSTGYGYAPPATRTTTTTTTTDDYYVHEGKRSDDRPHVRSGVGLNAFGAAGSKDTARLGVGGRLEFVLPFGLTLGGSYTQHFTSEADRTAVRPLLGEIGWAIPVARHVEVRPMVGIGYAFASARGDVDTANTGTSGQSASGSGSASVAGFDVAPGAKISFVGRALEVYTLPKYHFISGNNFLGVEVGAGARF